MGHEPAGLAGDAPASAAHAGPNRAAPTRGALAALFALVWVSTAWFANDFDIANAITRMYAAVSILDTGSTRIDPYRNLTIDKAEVGGHTYTDKAPGMTLMALAPVAATKAAGRALGADLALINPDGTLNKKRLAVLEFPAIVFTTSLFAAVAAAVSWIFTAAMTGSRFAGLAGTVLVWLGTYLWGWSGRFFGHATSAALLLIAFAALAGLARSEAGGRRIRLAAVSAAALAWVVVVEFTAAPAAFLLFCYGLWGVRRFPRAELFKIVGIGALTGLAALTPLFVYNWVSFGKLVAAGYQGVVGFKGMEEGFLGLTYPKPLVMWELLFGTYRGLVWVAPILLFVPFGLWRMRRGFRAEAIAILAVAVYYLLLNASYYYWDGGGSLGPRHMTPMVGLMALPLAFAVRDVGALWRIPLFAVAALSLAAAFVCAVVTMTPLTEDKFPVASAFVKFAGGEFTTPLSMFTPMRNLASVALYLLVAGALTGALAWMLRRGATPRKA